MIGRLRKWLNLFNNEGDMSGFIEQVEKEKAAKMERSRNMECDGEDYEVDIAARIKAHEKFRRQMEEQARNLERSKEVRRIAIELVTQRVASGKVGVEHWALRAAFEDAKPEAEAIYDAAMECLK